LVNAIVRDLMSAADIPVIDWPALWYELGIISFHADLSQASPAQGYCFSGFRGIPWEFLGASALRNLRKIMIVRDPRDMLVSRYFSTKYSHGFKPRGTAQFSQIMRQFIEDGQSDIDNYCLMYSWVVNSDLFVHRDIILDKNTKTFRYEDFVYDKMNLAQGICDWFNLPLPAEKIAAIADAHRSIPEAELPDQHLRQAHPGDYLRKLKPNTITALNSVLSEYMSMFGYGAQ
jgi:Sulfotransferase domain